MSIRLLTSRLIRKDCVSSTISFIRYNHQEDKSTFLSNQRRSSRLRQEYFLSRYIEYVKGYEAVLEKNFPTAIRVYRVFMVGIKDFYNELKIFFSVVHKLNMTGKGLDSLTRRELEIYHQMPKDMVKVAPVLLISALPFANYVIFPLAYMLPRQLLCSHFWSLQQRAEFALIEQKKRLRHFKPVFRSLQWPLEKLQDHPSYDRLAQVVRLLGSGLHPSPVEVIECKPFFSSKPFSLRSMYSSHLRELLKMHNMHTGWRRVKRLSERAKLIHLMDLAIIREGGITELTHEELRWACLFRGLNPANMKNEDMVTWLNDWITVSECLNKDSWSLLLHCPVLLAYNHPSNWVLLH